MVEYSSAIACLTASVSLEISTHQLKPRSRHTDYLWLLDHWTSRELVGDNTETCIQSYECESTAAPAIRLILLNLSTLDFARCLSHPDMRASSRDSIACSGLSMCCSAGLHGTSEVDAATMRPGYLIDCFLDTRLCNP